MRENRNALSQVLKDSRNSKSIKQVSFQEQMIALDKEDHAMKKEDMELRKQLVDKFKNSEKQFNDALRALKANHQWQEEGVILATYTDSPGVFWLFYYEGLLRDIEGLYENNTIPGYWLDKKRGAWYRLMTTATSIKFRNIVKEGLW